MDRIAIDIERFHDITLSHEPGRFLIRRVALLAAAVVVAGAASACGGTLPTDSAGETPDAVADVPDPVTSSDEIPPSATQIPAADVDTLFVSSVSGISESRRQVIREASEFEAVWSEITGPMMGDGEVPEVDFGSAQALLLAMGERPSGGYSIAAGAMAVSGDTLYVAVDEVSPGPSCITTMALTQPVALLSVPAGATEVVFVESTSVLDCS